MNKVLILSFSFEQEEEAFQALTDAGYEPVVWRSAERADASDEDLITYYQAMEEKPVAIIMGADFHITEEFLAQTEGLKCISLNCAGYDHIDQEACAKYGVEVVNVPRRNFDAVADLAMGLMLCGMRNIHKGDSNMRAGKWTEGIERSMAVSGKTLGIVGMGAIGKAVARRAKGFDMPIVAKSGSRDAKTAEEYGLTYLDDEEFFRTADVFILCCPDAPNTHHMINKESLALMKSSAVIVNPSRGGLIEIDDLYDALKERRIAMACLDAYEVEPLLESRLFELDNILLTPHIGGLADKQIHEVAVLSAENCVNLLADKYETLNMIVGGAK